MEQLLTQLNDWISQGNAGAMATADEHGTPELCRIWAVRAFPDRRTMEVFVLRDCAGRTLENLARNPRASVNVTEPPTYRSIQFKGSARLSEPPDLQFCAQQLMRLETAFMAVGLPPTAARQMVSRSVGDLGEAELAEYVCIELSVDSAYDQSPKVGAGARLG